MDFSWLDQDCLEIGQSNVDLERLLITLETNNSLLRLQLEALGRTKAKWRKQRLCKDPTLQAPLFKILKLYYIDPMARFTHITQVSPNDDCLVSRLPGPHIYVKMDIPPEWKFIGEINRDKRIRRKNAESSMSRITSFKTEAMIQPHEKIEQKENCSFNQITTSTKALTMMTDQSVSPWIQLLLIKLVEMDSKLLTIDNKFFTLEQIFFQKMASLESKLDKLCNNSIPGVEIYPIKEEEPAGKLRGKSEKEEF
jgi:hypothetical protein